MGPATSQRINPPNGDMFSRKIAVITFERKPNKNREKSILFKAVLNLAAVLCLCSTPGLAANISLSPLDNDPAHAIVAVEGVLVRGDDIKFRTQVGRLTKAVVAFSSDGGNLFAGIEIGKTIRLKSFATAVLDGQRCASACALAWLGGLPRFMGRTGNVGFHAAYIERDGRASESGVGNALVGSYLTQIGLSETAVVYITQAAPTELTLLTLRDAEKIGIEVLDRKSTRLNSSHLGISYAVFCLKKKNKI